MGRLKGEQIRLWEADDLPLWTGTAPTVQGSEYVASETAGAEQSALQSTWAECPVCLDTGRVAGGYCECEAGWALMGENHGAVEHLTNRIYDRDRDNPEAGCDDGDN